MTRHRIFLSCLAAAAVLAIPSVWAVDPSVTSAVHSGSGSSPTIILAAYRAMSASQSRNYDKAQDISPRQMVVLLEVSERTGASLAQVLATGEHESAHTWNDHVRPPLINGNLGSATGVWQFQPVTFQRIVKKFGARLLAATEEDFATGRKPLDLGDGPFTDAEVRGIVQETVDGKRDAGDEELQLLRHNFAVLAFAKHYLSVDSGATTPEEDYLYHFLGATQGRRVLALARGEARDTLCVKPVEAPATPIETEPEAPAEDGLVAVIRARAALTTGPNAAAESLVPAVAPLAWSRVLLVRGREGRLDLRVGERISATIKAEDAPQVGPPVLAEPAVVFDPPPPVSSEWGLPANSPTVTGNLGMFYRDGKGQTQPFTWAEFMENLARRIRAEKQPALVRAKYGVGFQLNGGDIPERAFDPEKLSDVSEFRHANGRTVLVPEPMVTGTLNRQETAQYKQRLAELVAQGDDKPADTLPPEALLALRHLRMLPPQVEEVGTSDPQVQKALHKFRKKVGKDEPDDAAHFNLLMPAERIALEIYDRRLARYAELQACQQASVGDAVDLNRMRKMPAESQRLAASHIAALQEALAARGLLVQPTKKVVWRDKKRKKHVTYKTLPFAGKADKATVAALDTFQLRSGLRKTDGVLDAVTLEMLGLPPLEREFVLPLSGP